MYITRAHATDTSSQHRLGVRPWGFSSMGTDATGSFTTVPLEFTGNERWRSTQSHFSP
jgi:hypothetical protein